METKSGCRMSTRRRNLATSTLPNMSLWTTAAGSRGGGSARERRTRQRGGGGGGSIKDDIRKFKNMKMEGIKVKILHMKSN